MSSVQFSLLVTNTSGVISRIAILMRKNNYSLISQRVSDTKNSEKLSLEILAKGSGDLQELSAQLLGLRGVVSIQSVKSESENSKTESDIEVNKISKDHAINFKSNTKTSNNNLEKVIQDQNDNLGENSTKPKDTDKPQIINNYNKAKKEEEEEILRNFFGELPGKV